MIVDAIIARRANSKPFTAIGDCRVKPVISFQRTHIQIMKFKVAGADPAGLRDLTEIGIKLHVMDCTDP